MKPVLKIEKRNKSAILPEYKKTNDSGFDLSACLSDIYKLKPGEWHIFDTGLVFEIPSGYEIQIRSRSGLSAKNGIFVLNSPGTVDEGYRNEIKIILMNLSKNNFIVKNGDRIAQAIIVPVVQAELIEVESVSDNTDRGLNGFGSTGV